MMTAKINFITKYLLVDMTCRENELRNSLQNIGILIVPSMIYLDNRRTLQIQISADDEENKDVYMVALRDDDGTLIGYYEKHEYRNREMVGLYQRKK